MRLSAWLVSATVLLGAVGCVSSARQEADHPRSSAVPAATRSSGSSGRQTVQALAALVAPACPTASTLGAPQTGSVTCEAARDTAIVLVQPTQPELVASINRGQLPAANWVNRLAFGPNWFIIASSSGFAQRLAQLTHGRVGVPPGVRLVPAVAGTSRVRSCRGTNAAAAIRRSAGTTQHVAALRPGTIVGVAPPRPTTAGDWIHWHVLTVEGAAHLCEIYGDVPIDAFAVYKLVSPGRVVVHVERDGGDVAQLAIQIRTWPT